MSERLFRPPGPQVTPAEARGRRDTNHAAQESLPLAEPTPPAACPACAGTHDTDCPHEALTLEIDPMTDSPSSDFGAWLAAQRCTAEGCDDTATHHTAEGDRCNTHMPRDGRPAFALND